MAERLASEQVTEAYDATWGLQAMRRGAQVRDRQRQRVSEWAAQHMRTERGEPLDFEAYTHMAQPMDEGASETGLMCGSQTGKTTVAVSRVFWFCDTYRVRVIYTMHTQWAVQDFSQTRARPAIQSSPYLAQRIRGIDSVGVKQFIHDDGGRSVIFFRGAQAESAAISEPADMLVHDEVDFSDAGVLRRYRSRIAASTWARRMVVGTPTVPGYGMAALWEDSSQTQWLVKCPVCGDERPLTWPESLAGDADPPHYVCSRGHELTRETIQTGRWVDARTRAYTWRMYHVSRLLMPLWPAERVLSEYEQREYQDDPALFFNEVLGLPKSSGELEISEEILAQVMVGFPPAVESDQPTFAGCDQSPKENSHRLLIGTIDAEGAFAYMHAEVCGWDRLAELMRLFHIDVLVIDALPESSKARELREQFPGRVYLAWYPSQPVKRGEAENIRLDRRAGEVQLDRTATLDVSARRLRLQQDFFCAMRAKVRETFIAEMMATARAMERDDDGQPHARWISTGPDHFRHAHNYATVAGLLFSTWGSGPSMTSLDLGTSPEPEVTDERTGETHVIRPGHIPVPDGVVDGTAQIVDWRRRT